MKVLLLLLALASPAFADEDGRRDKPSLIRTGGIMLYYSAEGPLSFMTMTPGELPPGAVDAGPVFGKTCQHGLSIPITPSWRPSTVSGAKGDSGFMKTLAGVMKAHPGLGGVYDVKVDLHITSILGFYRRTCTELTARGYTLPPPQAPEPRP
ncbi:MAG: hypothetical protein WC943_07505 [Elusimicrobiota bacterium]